MIALIIIGALLVLCFIGLVVLLGKDSDKSDTNKL